MEASENLDLQAETLSGDIRDVLLTHIRSMETPWSKLSEAQQADKIYACEKAGRDLVRRAVNLVSDRGFAHLQVQLQDWTVKDGIKLKVGAAASVEAITKLAEHQSQSAVLVFASTSDFLNARTEVQADPDQPDLEFDPDTGEIQGDSEAEREAGDQAAAGVEMPEPPNEAAA